MKSLSASAIVSSWLTNKELWLTFHCIVCVPLYGMLMGIVLYTASLRYAVTNQHTWVTTALLIYLVYCVVVDGRPTRVPSGDRRRMDATTEWCRSIRMYTNLAAYFPIHLHKTVDLDPTHVYLFVYHPHGVFPMGAFTALATNGCHFSTLFPGIQRHAVTLNVALRMPIFREWMLLMGIISANKKTIVETLRCGRSVVLVPGGAKEALLAHSRTFRLYIKDRKGFSKVAMDAGALPVPVLGFGENDAFETLRLDNFNEQQVEDRRRRIDADNVDSSVAAADARSTSSTTAFPSSRSILHSIQHQLYKLTSFPFPILTKIRPNRIPIDVVVGKPIQFQGTTVDECHSEYLTALRQLYDEHKAVYGYQDVELEFV